MQFLRSSLLSLIALNMGTAEASESDDPPRGLATRLEEAPTLDGRVAGDPAWRGVTPFSGFKRDYRAVQLYAERNFVNQETLNEWRPLVIYRSHWDFNGFRESGNLHLESWYIWKSGADIWPAVNFSHEGVKEPFTIAGVEVPAGSYKNRDFEMGVSTARNRKWSSGTHLVAGGFYNGKRFGFAPYVNYRKDESFNAWASLGHNTIGSEADAFSVNVFYAGMSYSFTPQVRLGTLMQYNDADEVVSANVRFSWLRSANAGLLCRLQ